MIPIPFFMCLFLWQYCHAADDQMPSIPELPVNSTDHQISFCIEVQTPHNQDPEEQTSPSIPSLNLTRVSRNSDPESTGSIRQHLIRSVKEDTPHTTMCNVKKYEGIVSCNRTKDRKKNNLFQLALLHSNIELAEFMVFDTSWNPHLSYRNKAGRNSYDLIIKYEVNEPREFLIKLNLINSFNDRQKKKALLTLLSQEKQHAYRQHTIQSLLESQTLNEDEKVIAYSIFLKESGEKQDEYNKHTLESLLKSQKLPQEEEDALVYRIFLKEGIDRCINSCLEKLENLVASQEIEGSMENNVGSWSIKQLMPKDPRPSLDRSISIKIKELVKSPRDKKEITSTERTPPFTAKSEPSSFSSSSGKHDSSTASKILSLLRRNKSDVTTASHTHPPTTESPLSIPRPSEKSKDKEKKKKKSKGKEKE